LKKDIKETLEKLGKTKEQIKKQKMKNTPFRISIIVDEIMDNFKDFEKKVKEKSSENIGKEKSNG